MITIHKDSKIYLMCPPNFATGGPELIHQLAYKLKQLGMSAVMFYYPLTDSNPVHPNYVVYDPVFSTTIHDHEHNILILPEVLVGVVNDMHTLKHIRKYIWWLSVDNFFAPLWGREKTGFLATLLGRERRRYARFFSESVPGKGYAGHLVQSHYAKVFLKLKGISAVYLSDYLNNKFVARMSELREAAKQDIVLYNPKKGLAFTKLLMTAAPDIQWLPLIDLSQDQVSELLLAAKVYVDFGEHPGKDRFPREAAILGCCIVTGKRGAAQYDEDLNIPAEYRIEDKTGNIKKIVTLIKACLADYDLRSGDFEVYKNAIQGEEAQFDHAVKSIFQKENAS